MRDCDLTTIGIVGAVVVAICCGMQLLASRLAQLG